MGRVTVDLSGHRWQMSYIRPGQGVREGFHRIPCETQGTTFSWTYARVPGDVYTDLHRAGEIDDPFYGRNMGKAKWVHEYEWWYLHKFNIPAEVAGKRLNLVFEGVDYCCEVWLNGNYLGDHSGMFSSFSFDITNKVRYEKWNRGANILMVKLDPPPRNFADVAGKKFNFSGDYLTGVVPIGIWRPVKIVATGHVKLNNHRIESVITEAGSEVYDAKVRIETELDNLNDRAEEISLLCTITGHTEKTPVYKEGIACTAKAGRNTVTIEIDIPDAVLWWPWDLGTPALYRVELCVEQKGTCLDSVQDTFGIRSVEMAMNPGFASDEAEYPWTFVINGRKSYLRSACWGGPPSFLYGRNTKRKYQSLLRMVRECNINNLRIFGWHPPEVPEFYRLCDELGITVWTNFTFSTQVFSDAPDYIASAVRECESIVEDRRNHPSTILWMGGEEVFFNEAHGKSSNRDLMETIGKAVARKTSTPYGLASPLSNPAAQKMGFKPKESEHANGHYYFAGRTFMEEYYPSLDCCIIPELTAASAPCIDSLKKFVPPDELWPMGRSWGYHWADIDILKALNMEVFNDPKTGSLEEFVEATQIAQGTILQFALEHYRRRKPRISGVAFCHFITHWPDIKWGVVDYYGKKKHSYDYARNAYQPLLITLEFLKRRWNVQELFHADIWIVNDYHERFEEVTVSWKIVRKDGTLAEEGSQKKSVVEGACTETIASIEWRVDSELEETFDVRLSLCEESGEVLSRNSYTLLVGDQTEAKNRCLEFYNEYMGRREEYGPSYYRYFVTPEEE